MAKVKKNRTANRSAGLAVPRIDRPLSLVAQVEQILRQAIAEGRFPGDRLPTEVELAEQLGVSRETVRRAAETLQREGLLVKIRRKGTFTHFPKLSFQIKRHGVDAARLPAGRLPAPQGQEEAVTPRHQRPDAARRHRGGGPGRLRAGRPPGAAHADGRGLSAA